MKRFTSVEARIDAAAHLLLDSLPARGLSGALVEFLVFGLKQAWACLFGGAMLALIIATRLLWPGRRAARPLRLPGSRCDDDPGRNARLQAGDGRRSQGDPDLPCRRHRDGDIQDVGRIVDLSGGELPPHRRRAAFLRLHVCGRRFLLRPHPAHLRRALPALSAGGGDGRAVHRDLRELLHASFHAGPARHPFRGDGRAVLAHGGSLPRLPLPPPHAAAARVPAGGAVHLVRGKHRHLVAGLDLSRPGGRLDAGVDLQARRLVSADDHIVRAGDAGSPPTAVGRADDACGRPRKHDLGATQLPGSRCRAGTHSRSANVSESAATLRNRDTAGFRRLDGRED